MNDEKELLVSQSCVGSSQKVFDDGLAIILSFLGPYLKNEKNFQDGI